MMLIASYFDGTEANHPYYSGSLKYIFLLSNYLFEIPLIYLISLITLKLFIFFGLFFIYKQILTDNFDNKTISIISIFSILFFTIGGLGRFQFGLPAISGGLEIYTRDWSQLLLLFGLLFFIKRQYFLSSLLISLTCLIHIIFVANLFAVLMFVLVIFRYTGVVRTIDLVRFSLPIILSVSYQMISMTGLNAIDFFVGSSTEASAREWYQYIYAQDADDLSVLYHMKSISGISYVLFQLFGIYLAAQTMGIKRFTTLITHPILCICFVIYAYLLVSALIEVLQMPEFILEKIIILQPRRMAYIPVMILSCFVTKYGLEYFWNKKNITIKYSLVLIIFLVWFFAAIYLTNDENTLSMQKTATFFLVAIMAITLNKIHHIYLEKRERANILRNFPILLISAFVLISVRTAPYANAETVNSIRATYFTMEARNYLDYFVAVQNIKNNQRYAKNVIDAVAWIKEGTTYKDNFLAVGLGSEEMGYFTAFAGRPHIQSLNLHHYRGPGAGKTLFSTFYDLKSYIFLRAYYKYFLGVSIEQPSNRLERLSQLKMMQKMVYDFSPGELREKMSIYGKQFNYALTTKKMANFSLPSYSNNNFFIYKISNGD